MSRCAATRRRTRADRRTRHTSPRGNAMTHIADATPHTANAIAPLRDFVTAFGQLLDTQPDEPRILAEGGALLRALVARDDWLPEAFAQPHPVYYQQHLLHA